MFILDASGKVTASSEAALLGINLKDGLSHRVEPDPHGRDPLHIAAVRVGPRQPGNGGWTGTPRSFGGCEGLAAAGLDGRYFEVVMRSVMYAKDMQVALAHADGQVFIGLPRATAPRDIGEIAAQIAVDSGHSGDTPQMTLVTRGDVPLIVWRERSHRLHSTWTDRWWWW